MIRLAIVILNYRTPQLVFDCLRSLETEIQPTRDCVVVVDNASGDDSPQQIQQAIETNDWSWAQLVVAPHNGGFSAGNNFGMQQVEANAYFLINSDTLARENVLNELHRALDENPQAGLISPRLEWPDTTPQISCFRYISPVSELLEAAKTSPITKLFPNREVALPVSDMPIKPAWTSFAACVVRRAVIEQIGWMDEGYFMYFEDVDFCRRAWEAGWEVLHVPTARMVHLRGGTSEVKEATKARKRRPRYFYAARTRYFAKFYGGRLGILKANLAWTKGRSIAFFREKIGNKQPHTCLYEERDIWTNWRNPLAEVSLKHHR